MLDIKFIRENADRVQKDAIDKGYKNVNIQDVLSLDSQRKSLSQEIDDLRTKRNQLSASMKNSGGR
ncbi:serine--tRNA ligase, partial [Candidatus Saccharibacteria bacterium]|nr:serine--tRNA ligase [Candidatus Saccharibacteria bacterium]